MRPLSRQDRAARRLPTAYWLLLPCYALIFWHAGYGYRPRSWRSAPAAEA